MSRVVKVDRRDFLKISAVATGGLVLGVHIPMADGVEAATVELKPNVFVAVDTDGQVTIWLPRPEMGQGSQTGLTMILADELGCRWDDVEIIMALAGPREVWGSMTAGGSTSIRNFWGPMGDAGAAAREMLIAAAATRWGVAASACRADQGRVEHAASGRSLGYGELAEAAATLPVPESPPRKDRADYRYIGKPVKRLDIPDKVDGSAVFGIDVRVPGMKFATIRRCPVVGGRLRGWDDSRARRVRGFDRVVETSVGVAVVASDTWAAFKAMEALDIDWDLGPNADLSSEQMRRQFEAAGREPGLQAERIGDPEAAFGAAASTIQAVYEAPYISHSPLEPMNGTAHFRGDVCEVWVPTQAPQTCQSDVARRLELPSENVILHTVFTGGGFGRRLSGEYAGDAAEVSRALGGPVQVLWTREEDTTHTAYRPFSQHHLEAGFDAAGDFTAWRHKVVAHSMSSRTDRVYTSGMSGAFRLAYSWPSALMEWKACNTPVPVSAWRSVYASQNVFATEGFLDEVAVRAGRDPLQFRLDLLEDDPRLRRCLETAAEAIGWGRSLPAGRGLGIACCHVFGSRVAQAAEVSVNDRGEIKIHRVDCAVDCGWAVYPDQVAAQFEGGTIFALTAAVYGEITHRNGRVEQLTYAEYPLMTMEEAPVVNTHIIEGGPPLGGIGEPPVPAAAPSVANAIYAACGRRLRRMPFRRVDMGAD